MLLLNLDLLDRALSVVVVGARGEAATQALAAQAWTCGRADVVLQIVESGGSLPRRHPAFGKGRLDGAPAAYVCQAQTCSLPVTDAEALAALLRPPAMRDGAD